jgi:hypothetical protein
VREFGAKKLFAQQLTSSVLQPGVTHGGLLVWFESSVVVGVVVVLSFLGV